MPVLTAALPALFTKLADVASITPAPPTTDAPEAMVRLAPSACMVTMPAPVTGAFTLIACNACRVRLAAALVQLMAPIDVDVASAG